MAKQMVKYYYNVFENKTFISHEYFPEKKNTG